MIQEAMQHSQCPECGNSQLHWEPVIHYHELGSESRNNADIIFNLVCGKCEHGVIYAMDGHKVAEFLTFLTQVGEV